MPDTPKETILAVELARNTLKSRKNIRIFCINLNLLFIQNFNNGEIQFNEL